MSAFHPPVATCTRHSATAVPPQPCVPTLCPNHSSGSGGLLHVSIVPDHDPQILGRGTPVTHEDNLSIDDCSSFAEQAAPEASRLVEVLQAIATSVGTGRKCHLVSGRGNLLLGLFVHPSARCGFRDGRRVVRTGFPPATSRLTGPTNVKGRTLLMALATQVVRLGLVGHTVLDTPSVDTAVYAAYPESETAGLVVPSTRTTTTDDETQTSTLPGTSATLPK
jgi:hypothetical protein